MMGMRYAQTKKLMHCMLRSIVVYVPTLPLLVHVKAQFGVDAQVYFFKFSMKNNNVNILYR